MKGASSVSGKCHTFDVKADGYIKAEAVNAVILKRLDDAVRDGDPIRAVIRGTATNSDGRTPGIASPDSKAQATAIRAAYANAGISDLNQTGYLECHGTGTQAGDPTEVAGVSSVFAGSRSPDQPLIIGSVSPRDRPQSSFLPPFPLDEQCIDFFEDQKQYWAFRACCRDFRPP